MPSQAQPSESSRQAEEQSYPGTLQHTSVSYIHAISTSAIQLNNASSKPTLRRDLEVPSRTECIPIDQTTVWSRMKEEASKARNPMSSKQNSSQDLLMVDFILLIFVAQMGLGIQLRSAPYVILHLVTWTTVALLHVRDMTCIVGEFVGLLHLLLPLQ